jgi:hypothetical protein
LVKKQTSSSKDYVECKICGKELQIITKMHLRVHDMTREDYMEMFDLTIDELASDYFRIQKSKKNGYRPLNKKEAEEQFIKIIQDPKYKEYKSIQEEFPFVREQIMKHYGSWNNAIKELIPEPEKYIRVNYWDDDNDSLITKIQELRKKEVPLNARYIYQNESRLMSRAEREFNGGWKEALKKAGIPKQELALIGVVKGVNGVLKMVSNFYFDNPEKKIPLKLTHLANHYCGSLRKAQDMLKNEESLDLGWTRRKITKELKKIYKNKGPKISELRVNHSALYNAIKEEFHSVANVMIRIGINPEKYYSSKSRIK